MNAKLKVTFVLKMNLLSFICFTILASLIHGQWIKHFDSNIITLIKGMESPWLTTVMKFVTFIGSMPIVIAISLFFLIFLYRFKYHWMEIFFFMIIIAGAKWFNQVQKSLFQRQRPSLHRLIEVTEFSFPSGHAMEAFALYASLAFLLWRHIPTQRGRSAVVCSCVCMILLIGISRIYLGVHYPSDVIGGYFASAFWFTLMILLFEKSQIIV